MRRDPEASLAFSAGHAVPPAGRVLASPPRPSPRPHASEPPPANVPLADELVTPAPRSRGVRFQAVVGLLLLPFGYRRLRLTLATAAVLILAWSVTPARSALRYGLAVAGQPLHERAAFAWQETFENGFGAFSHSPALSIVKSGTVLVRGLALHGQTMGLKNYDMSFSARVERKSIGWIVGASGPHDYYLFKLIERGRSPEGMRFDLVRYTVVAGVPAVQATAPVVFAGPASDFLDISVRVTEDHILTLVNGFGVDMLRYPKGHSGAAGFVAENGEAFLVRSLTISGNEDFLGLVLRGAEDTFHQISSRLSAMRQQQASRRPQPAGAPVKDS